MNVESNRPGDGEPDFDMLRRSGWQVNLVIGRYCVAWRGHHEALFAWHDSKWHQVPARPALRAA